MFGQINKYLLVRCYKKHPTINKGYRCALTYAYISFPKDLFARWWGTGEYVAHKYVIDLDGRLYLKTTVISIEETTVTVICHFKSGAAVYKVLKESLGDYCVWTN